MSACQTVKRRLEVCKVMQQIAYQYDALNMMVRLMVLLYLVVIMGQRFCSVPGGVGFTVHRTEALMSFYVYVCK